MFFDGKHNFFLKSEAIARITNVWSLDSNNFGNVSLDGMEISNISDLLNKVKPENLRKKILEAKKHAFKLKDGN